MGIPVGLNYEFWQSGGFHAYVMAGAEADYNVKNDTEEEGVKKEDAKRDRVNIISITEAMWKIPSRIRS